MKKHFFVISLVALFLFVGLTEASAQVKIGYINSNELLSIMPERDSLQGVFDKERDAIARRLEEMQVEYNNKVEVYVRQRDSLTPIVRETKEEELKDINARIGNYENTATQRLQQRQNELLQPLFDKVTKAIKVVALEQKFTYILDISTGIALYYPEDDKNLDVLPLVKAKLGLK